MQQEENSVDSFPTSAMSSTLLAPVADEALTVGDANDSISSEDCSEDDATTALAVWTEDIVLDPGTIRFPIRVVVVDNQYRTIMDRLVKLPKGYTTYIYRVLDHGIPWQHLEAGLTLDEAKKQLVAVARGKRLVMYDAWKTIGLFDFTEQQLSRFKIFDLRTSAKSLGPNSQPLSFWNLVQAKLAHRYTGKPGNYDTIELTDFVMSLYLKFLEEDERIPANGLNIVEQLQLQVPVRLQ